MFQKPINLWSLDPDLQTTLDKAETKRHNDNMLTQPQRIKENNQKLKATWKAKPY
jgi:hypothetical protein